MLKKVFCILFVFSSVVFSADKSDENITISAAKQIASFSYTSDFLIGGVVSPISGQLCINHRDLIAKGAESISIDRLYISPLILKSFNDNSDWDEVNLYYHLNKDYQGWIYLPHLSIKGNTEKMIITDSNGMTLEFAVNGLQAKLLDNQYGLSNIVNDMPSGRNDPRNTKVVISDDRLNVTVYSINGTQRFYKFRGERDSSYMYCNLQKEILSNGRVIKYTYNKNNKLILIESLDPEERYVYASIKLDKRGMVEKNFFATNMGKELTYSYITKECHKDFKHKKSSQSISIISPSILSKVESPFYCSEIIDYSKRFLLQKYIAKDLNFTCHFESYGKEDLHNRVNQLSFPVGPKSTYIPVYTITYDPPVAGQKGGTTNVQNRDGSSIVYSFSNKLLIDAIKYFDADKNLRRQKIYKWSNNNWLKSVEEKDINNNLLCRKSYEYDSFGNPVVECFEGNLSGEGSKEKYVVKRAYTEDGRNLLLKEEESGKVTHFSYLKNTNLITSKIITLNDEVLNRSFFKYDDCHNLIAEINDDGTTYDIEDVSLVKQRNITSYTLRQESPYLHMVSSVEKKYLENGEEKLLTKKDYTYDKNGNIAIEDIYDSSSTCIYSIYREYNERGDLLSETNPERQKATYTYDYKGNCVLSSDFFGDIKHKKYDVNSRLIEIEEIGLDSIKHSYSNYVYDSNGNVISEKDINNNITFYEYDTLCKKVAKTTIRGAVVSNEEKVDVESFSDFDALGRVVKNTDAMGNVYKYSYNSYGSVTEKVYPNDSKETFKYYTDGKLKKHTQADGLETNYEYDALGQNVSKQYFFDGNKIAEEKFTYLSNLLSQKVNKDGHVTSYTYDSAGRLTVQSFEGREIGYEYDKLGRIEKIIKRNGENTFVIIFERDLLGKVTKENKKSVSGDILSEVNYLYDERGNINSKTCYIDGKKSIEIFKYDSLKRLVSKTDPLGNITEIDHVDSFVDEMGIINSQRSIISSDGVKTIFTYDLLGREIKKEVKDSFGVVLSIDEYKYDLANNLLQNKYHLYEDGKFQKYFVVQYEYTSLNQLASKTEGVNTPSERTIFYKYTPQGKRKEKILPSGVTISYKYNSFGSVSEITSSDNDINQRLDYSLEGYLVYAEDKNNSVIIERNVDPFGNIIEERFLNEGIWDVLKIQKSYDNFNREQEVTLPDQSKIKYNYDPLNMKKVSRVSFDGEISYSHSYNSYDLSGNLLGEILVGGISGVEHNYDLTNKKTGLSGKYLDNSVAYDLHGNVTRSTFDNTISTYLYNDLSQLMSEKGKMFDNTYVYDSNNNLLNINGKDFITDDLNQILSDGTISYEYDVNGNIIRKDYPEMSEYFSYDSLNRLVSVTNPIKKIYFKYDPLGRKVAKTVYEKCLDKFIYLYHENYVFSGNNEIGTYKNNVRNKKIFCKQLKVLGANNNAIAMELDNQVFVPIIDIFGNVKKLVNFSTKKIFHEYEYTTFGNQLNSFPEEDTFNPWGFSQKRWDKELNLIYLDQRYYNPAIGR